VRLLIKKGLMRTLKKVVDAFTVSLLRAERVRVMSSRMQMERWHGDVVTGRYRLRLDDVARDM
jgi:hypothetical protein